MSKGCEGCRGGGAFDKPFSMAFQPIVDVSSGKVFAHEALVRGPKGEGAHTILSAVDQTNRYAFDQMCRVKAIELAAALRPPGDDACLSINFMPNAVYEPRACIRLTLDAADEERLPPRPHHLRVHGDREARRRPRPEHHGDLQGDRVQDRHRRLRGRQRRLGAAGPLPTGYREGRHGPDPGDRSGMR